MLKKLLAIVLMLFTAMAMAAVDVNKATDAQLDSVKGIGPGTSKIILAERKKGHFKDWPDFIERVKGVGEARAAKLSEAGLTVNGTAYKEATATKKDDKKDAKATTTTAAASAAKAPASSSKAAASAKK
ncbi:MAG: hypothetical protein JWP43_1427 [Ramlibacter sp.]|jgi:competence protein ComEA|nr:hypothetical protein [Ramlibacter sp.]